MIYVLPVLFALASLFFAGLSVKISMDASKEITKGYRRKLAIDAYHSMAVCLIFAFISIAVFNEIRL